LKNSRLQLLKSCTYFLTSTIKQFISEYGHYSIFYKIKVVVEKHS
jgi:hypothetical protein